MRRTGFVLTGSTPIEDRETTYLYCVTVKLDMSIKHRVFDDYNKVKGQCPIDSTVCTDRHGRHHTFLVRARSTNEIEATFDDVFHITRTELISDVIDITNDFHRVKGMNHLTLIGFNNTRMSSVLDTLD